MPGCALVCTKGKNLVSMKAWDCDWFEREPGADYPYDMDESSAPIFISLDKARRVKCGQHKEDMIEGRQLKRELRALRNA